MIPLFEIFPQLRIRVPYVSLCQFPTPIQSLSRMAGEIGVGELYLKQDGLTALSFGGNKIRKLEFLLGVALRLGAREVMTFGFAGSNHALAVGIHAHRLGLKSISLLMPQQNAHYVRRNLLMGLGAGVEIHYYADKKAMSRGARVQRFLHALKTGRRPFIIPPGGSTPVGVLGYINAVFEWQKQLEQNNMAVPDVVYVALGTAGTFVGLQIGFKVLGIKSQLIPVRVVNQDFMNKAMVLDLFAQTVSYLSSQSSDFPRVTLTAEEFEIRDEFLGEGYSCFTEPGMEAVRLMKELEDIGLDGTYTAKVFAAILYDGRQGVLKDQKVWFWNTLNAHDATETITGVDYHRLPKGLHCYFEEEVQRLDN